MMQYSHFLNLQSSFYSIYHGTLYRHHNFLHNIHFCQKVKGFIPWYYFPEYHGTKPYFPVKHKSFLSARKARKTAYFRTSLQIVSQCTVPGNMSTAHAAFTSYPAACNISRSRTRLVGLQLIYTISFTPKSMIFPIAFG